MSLSKEQTEQVAAWVQAGDDISSVQTKIVEQFSLNMTYMEVRFLIDDLELELVDEETPAASDETAPETPPSAADGVTVEVERIPRAGAMVSGSVTFSDGVTMEWQVDASGRLGLIPGPEDYQPPADDLPLFQQKLQEEMEKSRLGGL